ncbi:MAG: copper oxidase, partial [Candidatus Binatia bacterium]
MNIDAKRVIKAAVIQIDAIMNKAGWHFPQTRLFTLWGDVGATQDGTRPPEPFFIRAHSNDCIEYHLTNLLPSFYDADDFQVFTPTDIIGQHIHLVKFDVTSSDGSGNGWNYEDGSFAPDEVLERIEAINAMGGLDQGDGTRTLLAPRAHPYFGVLGAQTTIQRWWADPLLNAQGDDRTIRTVFTHDHFGPSTHQQAGLYAALLIEPSGSSWRNPETGEMMGNRFDGGPTSWHADILTADPADSHREFMIEFQDFALAYTADNQPVNPPGRTEAPLPFMIEPPLAPMPEAISTDDVGTFTVNYRNEPLALRIRDPLGTDYDGSNGVQALGRAGDLAYAYQSRTDRADPAFNVQPNYYGPLSADVGPGDPYTPMMRAYEGDNVQIRMIAGGAEEGHNWSMHGVKWLHEPDDPSSGFRNSQMAGISEHFEFELGRLPEVSADDYTADFLYKPGASVDDQWNGLWGLLREYEGLRNDLLPLPNNPDGRLPSQAEDFQFGRGVCPVGAPVREYQVSAVAAADALEGGTLMYNRGHGLHDPTALLYVATEDLYYGHLKPGAPIEPLILRASAGECIRVTLRNQLPAIPPDLSGYNLMPMVVNRFNANQIRPSAHVGLHPQLVHYDVRRDDGIQVGNNKNTTVGPGQERTYIWYAGDIEVLDDGTVVATPIEFGGVNLLPADLIKHSSKGLVGALVIEPQGSSWSFPNADSRATADVTYPGGSFREFVMVSQDDIQLRLPGGEPVKPAGGEVEDPEDSGNGGINYKSEPMWTRAGYDPNLDFLGINDLDLSGILSIADGGEIETPIFSAEVGTPVRFRVL